MSVRRVISDGIRRVVGSGPGAGALTLLSFFGLDFVGLTLGFMGVADEQAIGIFLRRFGRLIVLDQLRVVAVYLVVGACFGGVGALVGMLWDFAYDKRANGVRRALRGVLAALIGHGYCFLLSMVQHPQLYSESFYDRGGVRRWLMLATTEHLTPLRLRLCLALVLCLALGPPLRQARVRSWLGQRLERARAIGPRARWLVVALPTALLVLWAGLAAYGRAAQPATKRPPDVLLLAVDSLRADRVFTGSERFPALHELAEKSVRFREAHVTVPRTFPSFVTLLTGRYPHHHGIRHMFPTAAARAAIGPALPALLRDRGYRTVAISDYAGEIFSRTPFGFTRADVPYFDGKTIVGEGGLLVHANVLPYAATELGRRLFPAINAMTELSDPGRLADHALDELGHANRQPLFLTVFFSAAHFPYASPYPYYRRFAPPGYDGAYRYEKPPLAPAPANDEEVSQVRALYDGAVAANDDAIARILRRLADEHLADDTIVVLLADHGENLYDQPERGMGHGDHLRGSAADHVPLLVFDPRHRFVPHDVTGVVRDVDLVPTLAALIGVPAPPTDGVDLGPLLRGERTTLGLDAYQETELWLTPSGPSFGPDERLPYPGVTGTTEIAADDDVCLKPEWEDLVVVAKHRALRTDRWKLLYRPTRTGALWSLYDLAADPDERVDVAERHPEVVTALRQRLTAWMDQDTKLMWRGGFAVRR